MLVQQLHLPHPQPPQLVKELEESGERRSPKRRQLEGDRYCCRNTNQPSDKHGDEAGTRIRAESERLGSNHLNLLHFKGFIPIEQFATFFLWGSRKSVRIIDSLLFVQLCWTALLHLCTLGLIMDGRHSWCPKQLHILRTWKVIEESPCLFSPTDTWRVIYNNYKTIIVFWFSYLWYGYYLYITICICKH